MDIVKKLFGLKTSDEYSRAVPELEDEVATWRRKLVEQETLLRTAPFESSNFNADALKKKIRESEDQIDMLQSLILEARQREETARAKELAADIERRAADGLREAEAARLLYIQIDEAAEKLAELITAVKAKERAMQEIRQLVVKHGRPDLKPPSPIAVLEQHIGGSGILVTRGAPGWIRQCGAIPEQVPGYLPMHPDRPLARMKEVKL